jgi:Domain of unknown function (DUF4192)
MDPRRWPADLRPDRVDVRISDPGEIAAALPALLGFHPRESVVLVSLTGPSAGRVGLTVRADLPPDGRAEATAAEVTRSVRTNRPGGVLLTVVSEVPDVPGAGSTGRGADGGPSGLPHRELVHEVVLALTADRIPVRAALLVRAGRWWSYDSARPCCAPGAGTPLPQGVTALEAASVATGTVVERDRSDLVRRITGPVGQARGAMAAACARVAVECSARVVEAGVDVVAEESWAAITAAAARCRPGAVRQALPDRDVARVVCGLRDRDVRDRALELALGPDAAAAEILWTECTRRAPAPLDAAPATLLAVSAWLRGDGAMANVALTRALAVDPAYALARLLARALAGCVPPAELRAVIGETLARGAGPGW